MGRNPFAENTMADFEALKDQWSDIEDRDGVRLSWNTFPSSRMVRHTWWLVVRA